MHRLECNKSSN